jgi:hypothetical protein
LADFKHGTRLVCQSCRQGSLCGKGLAEDIALLTTRKFDVVRMDLEQH